MNGDFSKQSGTRFAFDSDPAAPQLEAYDAREEEEAAARYLSRMAGDDAAAPAAPATGSGNSARANVKGHVADTGSWSNFMTSLKGIDTTPVNNNNNNNNNSSSISFTAGSGAANFSNGAASGAKRAPQRNPFSSDELPVPTVKNPFASLPAPPEPPAPAPLAQQPQIIAAPAAEPVIIESKQAPEEDSPLPDWFQSEGLRMLRSRDYSAAITYYSALCDDDPRHPEGWLGLGAAFLGVENSIEASRMLVKGRELQPDFPVGALVRIVKSHDPVYWYNFTASLIDMRRALAYQCADEVLNEILSCEATSQSLYARALDVRQSVREALRTRADRQRKKALSGEPERSSTSPRSLAKTVLAVLAVAALLVGVVRTVAGWNKSPQATRVTTSTAPPAPPSADQPAAPAAAPAVVPAAKSKTATFIIDTDQGQGFSVKVDGQAVGSTPTGVEVKADQPHTIQVMGGEHYKNYQVVVQPAGGEERTIVAELKPSGH